MRMISDQHNLCLWIDNKLMFVEKIQLMTIINIIYVNGLTIKIMFVEKIQLMKRSMWVGRKQKRL